MPTPDTGYPGVPYGYPAYGAGLGLSLLYPALGLSFGFGGPRLLRPFHFFPAVHLSVARFYRPRFSYGPRIYALCPRFYSGRGIIRFAFPFRLPVFRNVIADQTFTFARILTQEHDGRLPDGAFFLSPSSYALSLAYREFRPGNRGQ